jgi:glutathione S-transferase
MAFQFYYWPTIQGRGEFVRLALEAAGAEYIDVTRQAKSRGGGVAAMMKIMDGTIERPPFAPPFIRAGDEIVAQTANILAWLGPQLKLVPADQSARRWAHQLQMTVSDFVDEIHDTHHPIASHLYYDEQKREAKKRAAAFVQLRLPKFLGYFERVLANNPAGAGHMIGKTLSYVDLSMFQLIAGLRYAYPRAVARLEASHPRLMALHDNVSKQPKVAAYLSSKRRIAFNQMGVFRHYPALDA